MGCCLSTKKPSHNDQNAPTHLHQSRDRAPPPHIEEETVKEILSVSETPKPIILRPKPDISAGDGEAKPPVSDLKDSDLVDDAVSEPARSELSSSTVTNEEERSSGRRVRSSPGVNSRVRPRPEWNSGPGRDRVVGRSPTRRSDLSPARRVVPDREQHHVGQGVARRGLRYDPNRKDPGPTLDGSAGGRRSRSPATSRSGIAGGNPSSIRRASQSPGRVRAGTGGGHVKAEENGGGGIGKWPSSNPNSATGEAEINPNESLENPLVSLECFIFL